MQDYHRKRKIKQALLAFLTFAIMAFPGQSASNGIPRHEILNATEAGHKISFLNDRARDITGADSLNAPGFVVPEGLTGEGQIVAVADSGLDIGRTDDIHPDLQSEPGKMPKVVLLKSWAGRDIPDDPDGHGTHMAATIAGTGAASDGRFRGIAPGASIYFQSILNRDGLPEVPATLSDLFWPAYSAGSRVHVDAWGGGPNVYQDSAAQVDEFIRSHPDFLVVFGAGNKGPSSGTITSEANSKNALAVGASILPRPAFMPGADDTASPAEFSSRGPAGDGRLKPELLAPGSAVISARSRLVEGNLAGYPDYTRMQGTSMAAAVAGGASTLLREYFKKFLHMATPSAALVKAALINGARPEEEGPPKAGYGVVNIAGTIIALKEATFRLADEWTGVIQGQEMQYTYHVDDVNAPFKATLVWTDPPADPGSSQTLVNDLDLIVQTPDGRMYYGNHFTGKNVPDRINNVEQVYLPSPTPGDYTVRVIGEAVRRNAVSGSAAVNQDYALVWGQPPAMGVTEASRGDLIATDYGDSFSPNSVSVVNIVNGNTAPVDSSHIFPGSAVYRTPNRAYLVARIWRAAGIKALKTAGGSVFTEINSASRLGGYTLAEDTGRVLLNDAYLKTEELPPGLEINAVINPVDQKIRHVRASFLERDGVISDIRYEDGHRKIYLVGDGNPYRISPDAAYSYEDSYDNADTTDTPFGTGALEELEEVLPGMPVQLHLAPSSGDVQYLAVKRRVALGTVEQIKASSEEIKMGNGSSYKIFPGAPVKRDRKVSVLEDLERGDHVAAVLLPDTGEAIGIVAYDSVLYGKVIDFARKTRMIYFVDDNGRYSSMYLPSEAIVYRWGVKTTSDAITAGCRIRIIVDSGGKEVWRMDIADTFSEEGTFAGYDASKGTVDFVGGKQYRISSTTTRFLKNGYPVPPQEFLPGEQIELEYAVAPPPTGNVLVTANARTNAPGPMLFTSTVAVQNNLVISGRTNADTVYLWQAPEPGIVVPVSDSGRFSFSLEQNKEGGSNLILVAVDRRTGGVSGREIDIEADRMAENNESAVREALASIEFTDAEPGRSGTRHLSGTLVTRAEAIAVLARLLNWPVATNWPLPFNDASEIPLRYRPAVAEARARGIIKGYPDGSFRPMKALDRAEAAVISAALIRDLELSPVNAFSPAFLDAPEIPSWAAKAVAESAAAGLTRRSGGNFTPGDPVTFAEMEFLLLRLIENCEKLVPKAG